MYLGIDIGTSAVKLLLTPDGVDIHCAADLPLSLNEPADGYREQTPEDWWGAIVRGCAELQARAPSAMKMVQSIGLSGQMHAPVCLDDDNQVLLPAILWNDSRASVQCDEFNSRFPDAANVAGVRALPGFAAPKLMWIRTARPEIWARIAMILSPKDYIGFRLHGEFATDMSDASGMLMLDQDARDWSDDILAVIGVGRDQLPGVREGSDCAGHVSADAADLLGLRAGIPVAVGGGDVAVGALGVGAIADGDAILSLGTSGQVFVSSRQHRPSADNLIHAFSHCLPDRWFQMAALLNGARPLGWFAEMSHCPISDLLVEASEAPRDRPLFLPYLTGERTPYGDSQIRGSFYGLQNDTSRGQMMRAVVDAIAYAFRDGADALGAAGIALNAPLAIGGGTRSDLVLQTLADVLGVDVRRAEGAENGPALGAARLAALMQGAKLDDIAIAPGVSRIFAPDPSVREYHLERLEHYRGLYAALAPFAAHVAGGPLGGSFAPVMKATASDIV